ncbi:hypothetical protein D3C85_1926530 [compost metagenome]
MLSVIETLLGLVDVDLVGLILDSLQAVNETGEAVGVFASFLQIGKDLEGGLGVSFGTLNIAGA